MDTSLYKQLVMAAKKPTTRVRIAREELEKMTKEDLQKCWNLQDQYIDLLESKLNSNIEHTELMSLRESEEKLKQQQIDASRRENILVMRLTTKEHEVQEYAGQIQELKQAQIPTIAQLRSALLDPAVNLLFERMRKEMDALKARLEETQNELNAWKFTPDSNTGKRLMAKCRLLYQENEDLGKIIASGKVAKIEGDLALQKSFSEEMKKSQSELDEFLLELDEDVEGMQSTIYYLQQQLREAKEQISRLQKEKTGQTECTNPFPVNHLENNENGRLPEPNFILKNDTSESISSNDLNGHTSESVIKTGPSSPSTHMDNSETVIIKQEIMEVDEDIPAQSIPVEKENLQKSSSTLPIPENVNSVIVLNKDILNHDKIINKDEQTKEPINNIGNIEDTTLRTNEQNALINDIENKSEDSIIQNKNQDSNKISEANKGRKRTRPRTPAELERDESSLPVRKRTRRREAEFLQTIDKTPSTVEINTDAEFQAAHTLASWASKQERTEGQIDVVSNSLGNGEIVKEISKTN